MFLSVWPHAFVVGSEILPFVLDSVTDSELFTRVQTLGLTKLVTTFSLRPGLLFGVHLCVPDRNSQLDMIMIQIIVWSQDYFISTVILYYMSLVSNKVTQEKHFSAGEKWTM